MEELKQQLAMSRRKIKELEHARTSLSSHIKAQETELERVRQAMERTTSSGPESNIYTQMYGARAAPIAPRPSQPTAVRSKSGSSRLVGSIKLRSEAERKRYLAKGEEAVQVLQLELGKLTERGLDQAGRLSRVTRKVQDFDSLILSLHEKQLQHEDMLVDEFERKARQVREEFNVQRAPHLSALAVLSESLVELIEGQCLEIVPPSQLDDPVYMQHLAQLRKDATSKQKAKKTDVNGQARVEDQASRGSPSFAAARAPHSPMSTSRSSVTDNSYSVFLKSLESPSLASTLEHSPPSLTLLPSLQSASQPDNIRTNEPDANDMQKSARLSTRHRLAEESLLPLFPNLTLEQASSLLEQHGDNLERTMVAVMDADLNRDMEALDSKTVESPAPPSPEFPGMSPPVMIKPSTSAPTGPLHAPATDKAPLSRSWNSRPVRDTEKSTDDINHFFQAQPRLLVLVSQVRETCEVELEFLLDRNGIPIDRAVNPSHIISASVLFGDLDARIVNMDERGRIEEHLNTLVPVITFEHQSSSFRPLSVTPQIPLSQYRMDYDPEFREITALFHLDDGPVKFTAYNPQQIAVPVQSQFSSVIEIFTLVRNNDVLEILHMHLNDAFYNQINVDVRVVHSEDGLRGELKALDSNSLTIFVQGTQIVSCVATNSARRQTNLFFIQQFVEPDGAMVNCLSDLVGSNVLRVQSYEPGIVCNTRQRFTATVQITSDEDPAFGACRRKHPHNLQGVAQVEIVVKDSQVATEQDLQPVCVCALRKLMGWEATKHGVSSQH